MSIKVLGVYFQVKTYLFMFLVRLGARYDKQAQSACALYIELKYNCA